MAKAGVESLFTAALGLEAPWEVAKVELDTAKRRIDFEVTSKARRLACPECGVADQGIHDRVRRSWRHLDFFQFEAWLHAEVPRVGCTACGKTTQVPVPWARAGSGFTLLFEALALSLCQGLAVRQAAQMLRVRAKALWRRIDHYVGQARAKQDMSSVELIGIDETSLKRGHEYLTVVHDLQAKRLLFATAGRDHRTVHEFAQDLAEHGGKPTAIAHACMDMSAAYLKGVTEALPNAQVSYDRYHVVALANAAMDEVRSAEWKTESQRVREALGDLPPRERRALLWGMRRNPASWSSTQVNAMHWLQRANLKSARAWRLKMGLREVFAHARQHNDAAVAAADLKRWISWARRSRLESFKRLGTTLRSHFDAVVRGMLDHRSNAFVEAMNGLMQQAKRAARGFRTAKNFIAIAYLRLSKLTHLPSSPMVGAVPLGAGAGGYRV
ncbi:MAG TPA: ISL3 family transposase [Ideonella sp.]|nr:ISL3 family transposase [Ideonella sp.]